MMLFLRSLFLLCLVSSFVRSEPEAQQHDPLTAASQHRSNPIFPSRGKPRPQPFNPKLRVAPDHDEDLIQKHNIQVPPLKDLPVAPSSRTTTTQSEVSQTTRRNSRPRVATRRKVIRRPKARRRPQRHRQQPTTTTTQTPPPTPSPVTQQNHFDFSLPPTEGFHHFPSVNFQTGTAAGNINHLHSASTFDFNTKHRPQSQSRHPSTTSQTDNTVLPVHPRRSSSQSQLHSPTPFPPNPNSLFPPDPTGFPNGQQQFLPQEQRVSLSPIPENSLSDSLKRKIDRFGYEQRGNFVAKDRTHFAPPTRAAKKHQPPSGKGNIYKEI